jgi:hypothetical protein
MGSQFKRYDAVQLGDVIERTINNRNDPRWGETYRAPVQGITREMGGKYLTLWAVSTERDYLGNLYTGGPMGRCDALVEVFA